MKSILRFAALFVLVGAVFISSEKAFAAIGDITDVRISPDGWFAEVDIEGFSTGGTANYGITEDTIATSVDNGIENPKVVFTVTSQGYDDQGNLGTIVRKVYGTKTVRKPYPYNTINSHTVMDEVVNGNVMTVKVALSEYIYSDDKAGGSGTSGVNPRVSIDAGWYTNPGGAQTTALSNFEVTNNSTVVYPKVIARWAWPGYERVTGDFLVEAVAFHRFAQFGKPVAAVKFTAADQSSHTFQTVDTNMGVSQRGGDANAVLVYDATIDVDDLSQGENITVNFTAYPWVGDENSVLNTLIGADGVAQPEERVGPLYFVNDKSGTYGVGYALVSPTGTSTGQVYATQAAAEAGSAFPNISAAAFALKQYHNTNHGRNSAGGGVILLSEGNYAYPATTSSAVDLGTMDTWLIIKPASNASKANTKISSGLNGVSLKAQRVKIEGITVSPSSSGGGISGRAVSDALWLHNNAIHATNTAPFYAWKAAYGTQNSVTALTLGFTANYGSNKGPFAIVRGNTSASIVYAHMYAILGNRNVGASFVEIPNPPQHSTSTNAVYAFNTLYGMPNSLVLANQTPTTGLALIQNVFERTGTHPSGTLEISGGGGNGAPTSNVLAWHNSFVGGRNQWAYNSEGTTSVLKSNFSTKYNVFLDQGIKTDTFPGNIGPNGNRTGNWSIVYGVGNVGDKSLKNSFPGDFDGLYSQRGPNAGHYKLGFVNDRANETGTGQGNGDYRYVATSTAIDVVAVDDGFFQVLPFDLNGNPRYGSADTGAFEFQPQYESGDDEMSVTANNRVYGNEDMWIKSVTTPTQTADLSLTIPGSDKVTWVDISISQWNGVKTWTEKSAKTTLANTVHKVGDLVDNTNYVVSVNGVAGQNISGGNCTSGICTSNSNGEITFTYTGDYATAKTFTVEESGTAPGPDETAPVISNGAPTSTLAFGTTQTTFSVETNENASCKYGTVASTSYANIANTFTTTGGTNHSRTLTGLTNNTSYTYYIRCIDAASNESADYVVSFAVGSSSDVTAPRVLSASFSKSTTTISILINFSEQVSGTATVTNTTGGTCEMTINNSAIGTCNYVYGNADVTNFGIVGVTGNITDAGENTLQTFTAPSWVSRTVTY